MKTLNAFLGLSLAAIMILSLSACGGKDTSSGSVSGGSNVSETVKYKDGTYKASAAAKDNNGYKATAEVVIKDGKVFSVNCDAESDKGTKKSISESGNYGMKAGGAQHEWHEEIALFEQYVVSKGIDAVSIDGNGKSNVVTGCTISVGDYVDLINEALEKAKSS